MLDTQTHWSVWELSPSLRVKSSSPGTMFRNALTLSMFRCTRNMRVSKLWNKLYNTVRFFKRLTLLFSKNRYNCSKVIVKALIMFKKNNIYIKKISISQKCCSFCIPQGNPKQCITVSTKLWKGITVFNIDNNKKVSRTQNLAYWFDLISISEWSRDIMLLKIQVCHCRNKLHFKIYENKNSYFNL